jgi:hypothetical protein
VPATITEMPQMALAKGQQACFPWWLMSLDDADSPRLGAFSLVHGLLKLGCIVCGFPLTVLCLMAWVGLLTEAGWLRLGSALLASIVLPALLIIWIVPSDKPGEARGFPTDLLALFFTVIPVFFLVVDHDGHRRLLTVEGDRLAASGFDTVAGAAYWLAAVEPPPGHRAAGAKATLLPRPTSSGRPGVILVDASLSPPTATAPGRPDAAAASADAAPGGQTFTPAQLFRQWSPSVVSIKISSKGGSGTGFVIDANGMIATNHHVIENATAIRIKLRDGHWATEVEILEENPQHDLALLKVKTTGALRPMRLGNSDRTIVGERVIAIGNPLGLEHTISDGLVSQRRLYRGKKWIQISVPISPGSSGGPLLNLRGEVIGVTTAGFNALVAQNINLAVPINQLKRMIRSAYPNRRRLGAGESGTW